MLGKIFKVWYEAQFENDFEYSYQVQGDLDKFEDEIGAAVGLALTRFLLTCFVSGLYEFF